MIRREWYADGQRTALVEIWRDDSGTVWYRRTESGSVAEEREATGDEVDELEAHEQANALIPVDTLSGRISALVDIRDQVSADAKAIIDVLTGRA